MNATDRVFILNNFNIVLTMMIVVMSLFIYYLKRESTYICFIIICFIEAIVFINFINTGFNESYDFSLECLFIAKILCIIINRYSWKSNNLTKIMLIGINIVGVIVTTNDIISGLIVNLFGNLIIFYRYIYRALSKIKKDLDYTEVQVSLNKRYIHEINRDISIEVNYNQDLNKKEEQFKNLYEICLLKDDIPMFILKDNIIIYKNEKLNNIFNTVKLTEFDIDKFFKNYFYYGEDISQNIKKNDSFFNMDITSFEEKVYTLIVFNIINESEKIKIVRFYDITNIYDMEEKIKFDVNSYKELIEVMDDGIVIADGNNIDYMSKRVNEIFNIKKEISSIENLSDYILDLYKQEFIKNIVIDRELSKNKTWYTNTLENKVLRVSQNALNIENDNLKLLIFSDITQEHQLMEDIEERERIYRVLLETLPDGIVIIDKNTKKYIYRNKYMIEAFKKIPIDRFKRIIQDYLQSGEFDVIKIINLNKKENASLVITDIKKQNIYIVVFKILKNNQKAEGIKEKLQKSQQTEDFKTQFCIDVVNKIKIPVDDMLYENKIMKEKIASPIIESHVYLVRQNLYRLKKVLDNVNDIMAIENYSYDLNYVVFDIVQLIKDISNLSKDYINKKSLNIDLEFSHEEILVYLDSLKLQKIILNILSNAIKFTNKGGNIKISVNKKIDFIVISIEDDGIGIPKDQMSFIFESFTQIDRGLSRLAEGMGVGLYLVKQLSEMQGIYLNVESELNVGSEFKILIKNAENCFLKDEYKSDICIEKEFIDIQFSDIYPA